MYLFTTGYLLERGFKAVYTNLEVIEMHLTISKETEDFLELFANEYNKDEHWLAEQKRLLSEEQFELTTEMLEAGAKIAWRNSNKCIGRLFWQSLKVFDRRTLLTAEEVFDALIEHIQFATNDGKIRPAISIFHPDRVRIWNHQLIRYAGYETDDGIIGDPHSLSFTKQLQQWGWHSEGSHFDILPLVIQIDDSEPRIFNIPKDVVLEVPLEHPDYAQFKQLQLKWYAVPIISDMKFECAGISFQAAPFNGWYMGTEIGARNLADENRYNKLVDVADCLHIKREGNISLWKDRALVELNIAVLHSFKKLNVSIVDHHTAATQFKHFQQQEQQQGRQVTGNWTWLIPPLSPAATHIFHEPIPNIVKKPNYFYQKSPFYWQK